MANKRSLRDSLIAGLLKFPPEVEEHRSRFAPMMAWRVSGREFLHFHGENEIDLRLTRAVIRDQRAQLRGDHRVDLRQHSSDWIRVSLSSPDDVRFALRLARLAVAANRRDRSA
jgi:hypothetical protein